MENENPIDKKVDAVKEVLSTSKTVNSLLRVIAIVNLPISGICLYGFATNSPDDVKPIAIPIFIGLIVLSIVIINYTSKKK